MRQRNVFKLLLLEHDIIKMCFLSRSPLVLLPVKTVTQFADIVGVETTQISMEAQVVLKFLKFNMLTRPFLRFAMGSYDMTVPQEHSEMRS